MKKLLCALFAILVLAGCEEQIKDPEPRLEISPDQPTRYTVPYTGGTYEVVFTSATEWRAEVGYIHSKQGWVLLDRSKGNGGQEPECVVVTVSENPDSDLREAELQLISGPHVIHILFSQERAIQQNPEDPGQNPDDPGQNPDDPGQNPEDPGQNPEDPGQNPENPGQNPEDPGQNPGDPQMYFEVLDLTAEIGPDGGDFDIRVRTNVEYKYEISAEWIQMTSFTETDVITLTFTAEPNTSESRTAMISFCGNESCIPVTVTQGGASSYQFSIDKNGVSLDAAATESPVVINVSSSVDWIAESDAPWCMVTPDRGTGNGTISISAQANTTSSPRAAVVTVAVASNPSVNERITVVQQPVKKDNDNDSWKAESFVHRSLVMRFTGDWCGYCPQMATSLAKAEQTLNGRIETISVHGAGSSLISDASVELVREYEIFEYPTGVVDGVTYVSNTNTTSSDLVTAVKDTESKYQTLTAASWKTTVSGRNVTLDLSAYIKKSGSYKITALILENGIIGPQADYINGDRTNYVHDRVLRGAFSSATGDLFEITEDNQIKDFAYSLTVPSDCRMDNMEVLVYIQRFDSESSSYYVDNSVSCDLGKNKTLDLDSASWGDGTEGIKPGDDITF